MPAAVIDKESCSGHTCRETDRGDQGRFVNIFLHHISQECRRHTQEEDCETERPLRRTFGEADVICDLLTENRPAVHRTDTAME